MLVVIIRACTHSGRHVAWTFHDGALNFLSLKLTHDPSQVTGKVISFIFPIFLSYIYLFPSFIPYCFCITFICASGHHSLPSSSFLLVMLFQVSRPHSSVSLPLSYIYLFPSFSFIYPSCHSFPPSFLGFILNQFPPYFPVPTLFSYLYLIPSFAFPFICPLSHFSSRFLSMSEDT
jgi:hypothetical protein